MKYDITFIIVNWRTNAETLECIESLRQLAGNFKQQIIVVDNETSSESQAFFARHAPECQVVTNERNIGFGAGIASAHEHIKGRYVALINNDSVVDKKWLITGVKLLKADPQIGIVGGCEYLWNEQNPRGSWKNDFITPSHLYVDRGYTTMTSIKLPTCEVPVITGSNMLLSTKLFQRLQGFDGDYFVYYEDVDICLRIRALGYKVVYSPDMAIWHKRGITSDKTPYLKLYYPARNLLLCIAKNFPENKWRQMVRATILDELGSALIGKRGGLRSFSKQPWLDWTTRRALFNAGLWGLTHGIYLREKRLQTLTQGQCLGEGVFSLTAIQDKPTALKI
jgi:GT2 family glycosyltransferase